MGELISVIIPVYNVENYLEETIKSVIEQTYQNLEIIIIDDGSTDNSARICDQFAALDKRVQVIHQENKGQATARNVGIDCAQGEWIAFLDSDDKIDASMYETLLSLAHEYDADISSCATKLFMSNSAKNSDQKQSVYRKELNESEIIKGFLTQHEVRFEIWNKLWKRSIVGDARFIPNQISEEVHWDRLLFSKVSKIAYTNAQLHYYRVSRPGNTKSRFRKERICVFEEFDKWKNELIQKNKPELAEVIEVIAASFAVIIYEEAYRSGQDRKIKKQLFDQFRLYYPNVKTSKYSNKKVIYLFRYFPNIYCNLVKMKRSRKSYFDD